MKSLIKRIIYLLDRNFFLLFLPYGSRGREFIKKYIYIPLKKTYFVIVSHNNRTNKQEIPKKRIVYSDVYKAPSNLDSEKISVLQDNFYGKRCFIVGNGPSLNKHDLKKLENEYTFGVNGIFYKTDEMGFKPTFYMVEDGHVIDDNLDRINTYNINYKFFPTIYNNKIKANDNVYFFGADLGFYREGHPSFCKPRFSEDFSKVAYAGQSVTFLNMQLAYYLGFTKVYLIGMDFNYIIRDTDKTAGASITTDDADVNHFHPEYFGYGKKWHDPKVDRVALNYEMAKKVYEKDGRKIYNATIGGKLEIFERVDYDSLFEKQ